MRPSRRSSPPATGPSTRHDARSRQAEAENQVTGALRRLFALSEAYPDLKANQNFQSAAGRADVHRGPDRLRRGSSTTTRSCATTAKIQTFPAVIFANAGLQSPGVLRGRRRLPGPGPGQVLIALDTSNRRCTTRSPRTSRSPRADVARRPDRRLHGAGSAIAVAYGVGLGAAGIAIAVLIAGALRVRRLLEEPTSSPCASAGPTRPTRGHPRPVAQPGRGPVHRVGSAPSRGLYVIDDEAPNAFATGRNPNHAAIAVTTGLLDKLNRVELEGVLAHELSHVKNYDILVSTLAVVMVGVSRCWPIVSFRFHWRSGHRRTAGRRPGPQARPGRVRRGSSIIRADRGPAHPPRHQPATGGVWPTSPRWR